MAIDPATSKALSHRLAVEQSAQRLPSVAAGLVRDGELVWSEAVGTLDGRAEGQAADPRTQYRVGSIRRSDSVTACLKLLRPLTSLVERSWYQADSMRRNGCRTM